MSETPSKRLVVGQSRLYSAPLKFNGMDVVFNPDMPTEEVRLVDAAGKILVRAIIQKHTTNPPANT